MVAEEMTLDESLLSKNKLPSNLLEQTSVTRSLFLSYTSFTKSIQHTLKII